MLSSSLKRLVMLKMLSVVVMVIILMAIDCELNLLMAEEDIPLL